MKNSGKPKNMYIPDKIYLCAICNIQSGTCNEDCKFCTQSVRYKANINRYKQKAIEDIIKEAKIAKSNKAIGYCLVTAGAGLDDHKVEFVSNVASILKKEIPDISLIACNGLASKEQLKELKKAGIDNYNHNLESSKEYYNQICTTHDWEDRYQTCLNAKDIGLNLCTGGIFGMGETPKDRISMLNSIKELQPMSVPLNFFHPNEYLPHTKNNLIVDDDINIIYIYREIIVNQIMIMVAGGIEITFNENQYDIFKYGANSIVIGNYLTTSGDSALKDIEAIKNLGFNIANSCKR